MVQMLRELMQFVDSHDNIEGPWITRECGREREAGRDDG